MQETPKTEEQIKKEYKKLMRRGMMNSAILGLQFGAMGFTFLKAGNTIFAIIGLLATVGTINDALSFYYANKEK